MIYFDTSFLIPLVILESVSDQIERFLKSQNDELAVSHWTRAEISSALARGVRMGGLNREAPLGADAQLESVISGSFTTLLPSLEDFDLCKQYLSHYETGLRAADALHLAIAANRRAAAVYSLDRKLVAAGRHLGLPVKTGIRVAWPSP